MASALALSNCSRQLSECEGPELNVGKLNALRSALQSSSAAPQTSLVIPNPIDATGNRTVQALESQVSAAAGSFSLSGLSAISRLENGFLKIRLHEIADNESILAKPDSQGNFKFAVTDPHYAETMAYYSITQLAAYAEALGFTLIKNRPLYVMVQAYEDGRPVKEVNAYYQHNTLTPEKPRTMKLFGETEFAAGQDRDIFWHEFGHYLNEVVSAETGIDAAGESGAIFTEGSAIHECLADYWAESVGNKAYIGKWIARNFSEIKAGDPLRSATDTLGKPLEYNRILASDSAGTLPERYVVAEWCSRVLWEFREQLTKEDPKAGAVLADRLVMGALSQLKRDSSISELKAALHKSDEGLHCGLHKKSITSAFESRGFVTDPKALENPLVVSAKPVSVAAGTGGALTASKARPGSTIAFELKISNTSAETARNVRVQLESRSSAFTVVTYLQGLGNLSPGQSLSIGTQGPLPLDYSVSGEWGAGSSAGAVPYRLKVLVENGPASVLEGDLTK